MQVEITEGELLKLPSRERVRGEDGSASGLRPLTEYYCTNMSVHLKNQRRPYSRSDLFLCSAS
jgi:hypothetical protein